MRTLPHILSTTTLALALGAVGCGGGDDGVRVMMDLERPASLFDAPFPSDDLIVDGVVDVSVFPNPEDKILLEQARDLLVGSSGFAMSGGVFFQMTGPIDPASLPALTDSTGDGSSVFLIGIDADAADFGRRYPVEVSFNPYDSVFTPHNMLAAIPLQGAPMLPGTRYAAVVTDAVTDELGDPIAAASDDDLAHLADVVMILDGLGVDTATIAGLTAFTTGDSTAEMFAVTEDALSRPLPELDAPLALVEVFDEFCVYATTLPMPNYQAGEPPFSTQGGTWQFDASGAPVFQGPMTSRLVVTIPRAAEPTDGYPLAVFVRTGGGGDRPLVDRGKRAEEGGEAIEAGDGPARYFARAGFAGMQVDGPLGGPRNVSGSDEQLLIFNIQNLGAMRDNIRQSAVELAVLAHVAEGMRLDVSDCPGADAADVGFDGDHMALMGHSMGATIGPLTMAAEPAYGALLLSGAGGSYIENIVYKRKPFAPEPVVGLLIGQGIELRTDDPVLSFAQWALEPSDPQVYDPMVTGRHVLMMQGIVDNYILPRIANTTTLSLGLDLAGEAADDTGDPRLEGQTPISPLLPLVGRDVIALPASGNGDDVTAVVTQHIEGPIEDGHEVVFQTDLPKAQYRCFLATWLTGMPVVPGSTESCPE